jgi:hypothetical protein
MPFHAISNLGKFFLRVLKKVRRGAVSFHRNVIFVLLIDEKSPWVGLMPMYLVHQTARFFARFLGKLGKDRCDFSFPPGFRHPRDREYDHFPPLTRNQLCSRMRKPSRIPHFRGVGPD